MWTWRFKLVLLAKTLGAIQIFNGFFWCEFEHDDWNCFYGQNSLDNASGFFWYECEYLDLNCLFDSVANFAFIMSSSPSASPSSAKSIFTSPSPSP